jgi:hypothetical protein
VKTDAPAYFKLVMSQLQRFGLLLQSDSTLPSVCSLISGAPVRGSWWSHPLAHLIFQVNGQLADHRDVLITKLISGKVTFVHRKLWPELFAIGTSRERWQTRDLSPAARSMLKMVSEQGSLRTDETPWPRQVKRKPGDVARELEQKLLIRAGEFHTATGAHAKLVESWQHWAQQIGFQSSAISADTAKRSIEESLDNLHKQFGGKAKLPWNQAV